MARTYKLTWRPTDKRWQKFYRGKRYYFPFGKSKTDDEGYRQALEAWEKLKGEIDRKEGEALKADRTHEPAYRETIIPTWEAALRQAVQFSELADHPEGQNDVRFCSNVLRHLRGMVNDATVSLPEPKTAGFDFHLYDTLEEDLTAANLRVKDSDEFWGEAATAAEASKTLGGNLKAFLAVKRSQALRGDISAGRYDNLRGALEQFEAFAGADLLLSEISAQLLMRYQSHLLETKGKKGKKLSAHSARDRLADVKQFLTWCYEIDALETLPRILRPKSKTLTIAVPTKKVETLPDEYIAKIVNGENERAKLYYLLMLNCGMYPVDVAELTKSEVDWRKGRIVRKRSKTSKHENAPEVDYKLWPETFRLLKEHKSKDKTLALTNENGLMLRRESVGQDGKLKRTNAIKLVHIRLCKRLKIPCYPLKGLRKTAASKLGEHDTYGRFVDHFLGHAPRTMAHKHYEKPAQALFDRAIDWLESALNTSPE